MRKKQRILFALGTRPEAIKMAPIILRLQEEPHDFETLVCATAQHREMLDAVLDLFAIRPQIDLDLMQPNQTINEIASRVLQRFEAVLAGTTPDWVLVQGDTTTTMAASLAAFHRHIKIAHVEAGLRTGDLLNPFPEEMNRRVTSLAASAHFTPTPRSAQALLQEGVPAARIHVTGNTVVDALQWTGEHHRPLEATEPLVLVTAHRRESFGEPMSRIFRAVSRLARRFPELRFICPVHPNPNVARAAGSLSGIANVTLAEPAGYLQLVGWLRACRLVLTDSGGIQEEAPTFGKPTLVLRETTERPEGIEAGIAKLGGTDENRIFTEAERLLSDEDSYLAMARVGNPYGDGRASERIADILAGREAMPFRPD